MHISQVMPYNSKEIQNILQLSESNNPSDLLLLIQLVKKRGLRQVFITEFYWMCHRLQWENIQTDTTETLALFNQSAATKKSIYDRIPLIDELYAKEDQLEEHSDIKLFLKFHQIDCYKLVPWLYRYTTEKTHLLTIKGPENPILKFIFKYGDIQIQKKILPFFIKKEHTGQRVLKLGGLQLGHLSEAILEAKEVHKIILWGNCLGCLPDIWQSFNKLEVLNLNDNKLRYLPDSIVQLKQLRKLYAADNCFEVAPIVAQLKQLRGLKYISISNNDIKSSKNSAHKALQQYEQLVNNGIINDGPEQQKRYLGLILEDKVVQEQLSCQDLFDALLDKNELIAHNARFLLLKRQPSGGLNALQKGSHIAVLGILAYATRHLILGQQNQYHFSNEVKENTNYIVLGDCIELKADIHQKNYIFISEEALKKALQ